MLILFVLLILGMIAVAWLVCEPITGIVGSSFIAKIMAVVVAFTLISSIAGWLIGPFVKHLNLGSCACTLCRKVVDAYTELLRAFRGIYLLVECESTEGHAHSADSTYSLKVAR